MQNTAGFRLSPQQSRLWLAHQDDAASFRAQCAILIEGKLDQAALRTAIGKVVTRHEVLRTTFQGRAGMKLPLQIVREPAAITISEVDLSALSAAEQQGKIEQAMSEQRQNSIDFLAASPLAVSLFVQSPEKRVLLLSLPSLCADSLSLGYFAKELVHFYGGGVTAGQVAEEPLQYADFSEWQNSLLEGDDEDARTGKTFWAKRESEGLPPLALPLARKVARNTKWSFDSVEFALVPTTSAGLDAFAKSQGTTSTLVLLAGWNALLWRLTGQQNIVVAFAPEQRNHEEVIGAVGLYSRSMPVNTELDGASSFVKIVGQTKAAVAGASKWQDYLPVEETSAEDDGATPDPVGFEAWELAEKRTSVGVSFSVLRQSSITSRFKLKLICARSETQWAIELAYDTRIFRREDAQRFADYYQRLLTSAIANPQAAIGTLEILDEPERHRLLVGFNQTVADYPQGKCLHHLFEEQAAKTPDRPALACGDRRLSYAQLNAQANQIAHYLRQRGVKPNVRVALCVERSAEMIIGLLGIMKSGGAYVPLIPDNPKARLAHLLQETQSPVLITQEKFLGQLPEFAGDILCLDRDVAKLAKESTNNPERLNTPQDLVYVIYTSGSTGVPKGVGNRHQNLVNYAHFICHRLHLDDPANSGGLHFATVSTISADLGNTCVFPSLISGGCLHVITYDVSMDGNLFASYAKKNPIDVLKITPSHFNTLVASPDGKAVVPRKYLVLGGEASTWDMVQRISNLSSCQVLNHYGPTETTVGSLTYSVVKNDPNAELSTTLPIGRPIANTQVYLLDSYLKPVPIGVPGELFISGAGVASGYLNQPEQTAERFVRNPFVSDPEARMYRTGDLARYLPDGDVEFLGRLDQQVKIRGFRVELAEIESVLGRNPAIQQTIVTAHADKSGDKKLVAYYVVAHAKKVSTDELRGYLKEQLPDYMVPALLVPLESMPLTSNGKIDRRALPDPETALATKEKVHVAPTNPIEEKLGAIWQEVLKVERVGIHDDFFELGGHSLLATQVIVRIRGAFDIQLPLRAIFESPTTAKLAALIIEAQKETDGSEDINAMLEDLEEMSDEEAQRLLADEAKKPGG